MNSVLSLSSNRPNTLVLSLVSQPLLVLRVSIGMVGPPENNNKFRDPDVCVNRVLLMFRLGAAACNLKGGVSHTELPSSADKGHVSKGQTRESHTSSFEFKVVDRARGQSHQFTYKHRSPPTAYAQRRRHFRLWRNVCDLSAEVID